MYPLTRDVLPCLKVMSLAQLKRVLADIGSDVKNMELCEIEANGLLLGECASDEDKKRAVLECAVMRDILELGWEGVVGKTDDHNVETYVSVLAADREDTPSQTKKAQRQWLENVVKSAGLDIQKFFAGFHSKKSAAASSLFAALCLDAGLPDGARVQDVKCARRLEDEVVLLGTEAFLSLQKVTTLKQIIASWTSNCAVRPPVNVGLSRRKNTIVQRMVAYMFHASIDEDGGSESESESESAHEGRGPIQSTPGRGTKRAIHQDTPVPKKSARKTATSSRKKGAQAAASVEDEAQAVTTPRSAASKRRKRG
eukprot:TRINITY_DN1730_c0_g4_i1.p1 TRINITY_DN1730_c0_g4~~TRINITY_DN1730_c0_g4_i1.p1  ORF type:complete len:312 (+),score=74.78 TRINITY_DN1730_c0_g4_i1:149-1084(+)